MLRAVMGLAVLLMAPVAAAAALACFTGEETLAMTPTGGVTLDGFIVQRVSDAGGVYVTDGGLRFDVEKATLAAQPAEVCSGTATSADFTAINPFTGQHFTVRMVTP